MKKYFFVSFLLLISLAGILRAQTPPPPARQQMPTLPKGAPPPPTPAQMQELLQQQQQQLQQLNDGTANLEGAAIEGDESTVIQPSPEGYTYDPSGRRDPFKPYGQSQATQAPVIPKEEGSDKPALPTDPLQLYDVSQFRLVGILWQVHVPKAVVRDPVGKMHLIYRDTKIGRNSGFVASIREGEVLVVEPTVSENGMPSAITRSMTLKK